MESIRKTPGSVLASAARTFIHSAMWILDYFYSYAGKFAPNVPDLRPEVVNFTLLFPNGEEQDFQVSKNNYDSYQSKRLRLILDVSCLPNGRFQILSATNEPEVEAPKNIYNWAMETATDYALRTTKVFQLILQELENLLDGEESSPAVHSNEAEGEDGRRKLSPRKRLPESRSRPLKRFMSRVWEIMGLIRPSRISFDCMDMNGDGNYNNCLSEPKPKTQEKRKYPSPDDSDSETSDDDQEENVPVIGSEEVPTPNEVSMKESGEIIEETETNVITTSNGSSPNGHVHQNGQAKNYLDAEGDEEYVSDEDPDYHPIDPTSSSGSSTGNNSLSDDNPEALQNEVVELKSDAARDLSAVKLDHDYHQ